MAKPKTGDFTLPFGAFCKKCKHHLIGEKLLDIRREMTKHFKKSHKRLPRKDVHLVRFRQDFKVNKAGLWSYGQNAPRHPYTFQSRLFCSGDYCIAVIVWADHTRLKKALQDLRSPEEKREFLRARLSPYFP